MKIDEQKLRQLIREAAHRQEAHKRRKATRRFTNEIGNPIRVLVEETQDTGTNHETGASSSFDAVRIVVEGPTSVSENTLTRGEAEELLNCLLRVLRPDPVQ